MNQIHEEENDLFELLQTLWDGKWVVSTFVAVAVLFGSGFIFYADRSYESKLIYAIHLTPPLYGKEAILISYKEKFYSIRIFEDWKKSSGNNSLVFEDFDITKVVDGFVLTKDGKERLATLTSEMGVSFVLVKTNQLSKLDGFFKYASHINEVLTREYVVQAKDQRDAIEARSKAAPMGYAAMAENVLLIDRFVFSTDKGARVLTIQHPTMPQLVAPKPIPMLAFLAILGGIMGVVFILVRSSLAKRKEQLAEAQEIP
jgi:hypothetical protein